LLRGIKGLTDLSLGDNAGSLCSYLPSRLPSIPPKGYHDLLQATSHTEPLAQWKTRKLDLHWHQTNKSNRGPGPGHN